MTVNELIQKLEQLVPANMRDVVTVTVSDVSGSSDIEPENIIYETGYNNIDITSYPL